MSVLIKGMNMPNVCGVCEIADAIKCDGWKHVRSVMLDRNKYCPLVEVSTPHGDLIDRGELQKESNRTLFAFTTDGLNKQLKWVNMCINDAQTIIESEE